MHIKTLIIVFRADITYDVALELTTIKKQAPVGCLFWFAYASDKRYGLASQAL